MRAFLRRRSKVIGLSLFITLSALDHVGACGTVEDDRAIYDGAVADVTRVLDGDTIEINIPDGRSSTTRVRLWGIDAPEIAHATGETDDVFGREAAEFVEEHYLNEPVRLALDPNRPNRDRYGRLLAYLFDISTGECLNEVLIEEGFAYADPRFEHVMKLRFLTLEKHAAREKAGLWDEVRPDQMPKWRQRR